jgi:hypothetical protein
VPILILGGGFGAVEQAILAVGQGKSGWEIGKSAAVGFGAGFAGAGAGVLVGLATKNPVLIGAVSSGVYGTAVRFANDGGFRLSATLLDAAVGGGAARLARYLVPKVPGAEPNLFARRPLSNYGPKSIDLLSVAGLGGELTVLFDLLVDMMRSQPAVADTGVVGELGGRK